MRHKKRQCIMVNSLFEDSLQLGMEQDHDPSILCQTVGNSHSSNNVRVLNFLFLGCEPNMPYGPIPHTAQIILDLMGQAVTEATSNTNGSPRKEKVEHEEKTLLQEDTCWMLRMKLYDVQKEEYPVSSQEWDFYDGIILPGSLSAAYDEDAPWIRTLCQVIQTEIVPHRRKTLGICFGHQVLAHSFADGLASQMSHGSRAGRHVMATTTAGQALLGTTTKNFYYSHGDQVERLPSTAVCLGGDDRVPILSAAYYGTADEAATASSEPYAITFQAHPEYASSTDLGLYRTLGLIMDSMVQRGAIEADARETIGEDAGAFYDQVHSDSLETLVTVGRVLGWFPDNKTSNKPARPIK